MQVSFQAGPFQYAGLHIGVKKAQRVAASPLRLLQGHIRLLQHAIHAVFASGKQCNANTGANG